MKKTILKYGAISALITTSMMLISTTLHYQDANSKTSEIIGFSGMFLAFIFIFLGIKSFRDKQNNGVISFGTAFKIGILICLIASTVYVATWMIECHFFFPDFMEKYAATVLEEARKSGLSATDLVEKQNEMEKYKDWYKNPILMALMTYMEIFPLGLIITVISALILKKK